MAELCIGVVWSFGLCFFLTPLVRTLASHLGLVDKPDGRRKLHGRCIPVAGGPVFLLSVFLPLLPAFFGPGSLGMEAATAARLSGLAIAALVICAVGVLDDLGRLQGRHKLLGQLAAITVVIATGLRIDSLRLLNVELHLGILAVPFTAFFLLGAINSLNLLDGLDGLLASFAFLLSLILGSLAMLAGKELTAYVAFTLAAALLAFLRYNYPPATIFLGDSGSMLIGLVIGVLAIDSSLTPPARMSLAAPLALFCLPILDTSAAIVRRKLTGRSIFDTDRSHLHHCLLRRLGDPRLVLMATSCYGLVLGVGVLAGRMLSREWLIYFTSFAVILSLVATRLFGYAEFQLLGRRTRAMLVSLLRLPHLDKPRQIEIHLYGNVDWSGLWQRILDWEEALHLCRLRLDVNAPALGEDYHAHWYSSPVVNEEDKGLWLAQIPLTVQGSSIGKIELSGRCNGETLGEKIVVLSKMVQALEAKVSLLADGAATSRNNSQVTAVASLLPTGQEDPELQCVRQ